MAHFIPDSGSLDSAEKGEKQKRTPQTTKPSMLGLYIGIMEKIMETIKL